MRVAGQFNFPPFPLDPAFPDWFVRWLGRHGLYLKRIAQSLPGPSDFALPISAGAASAQLYLADLVTVALTTNLVLTLDTKTRAGAEGLVEVTQDATGGRTVTWVNALWTNSTPPVLAAAAGKKTLLAFTFNGTAWVGRVLTTNY